jgi:uncharacterized FlaG/YvyC family protein
MGFDGIPRPAQINPYTDPMNPYTAGNSARTDKAKKPLVKALSKEERIEALQREQHQPDDSDDQDEAEPFSEEEEEQIRLFARMRGLMTFSLEKGVRYEFHINAQSGMVDLMEMGTGKVVLQLHPDELMQLSQKIQRYAGLLTDRSG